MLAKRLLCARMTSTGFLEELVNPVARDVLEAEVRRK